MDTLEKLQICTAYELDGQTIDHPPIGADDLARCTPVYEEMPGWQSNTAGCTSIDQLPAAAVAYVRRLEELVGMSAHIISTGPERNQNVIDVHPFS